VLTFEPGQTSQQILVPVNGDLADELNETFVVNLTAAANAALLDAQGLGTIADDDGSPNPPTNVVATATSPTSIRVTWDAAAGASSYRVYRRGEGSGYTLVGTLLGTTFDDTTVSPDSAYLYRVRSFSGVESPNSNTDLATTVIFTEPTLAAGTSLAKDEHFNELLTAVNAVRELASLNLASFGASPPSTGVTIRRQQLLDLRSGLDSARSSLGLGALTYTDPTITAGLTKLKAVHVTELRNGVR
jgi:hypothetical protein